MYLKKLSLSGFKTFANDTTLEFGQGITAIVGPNGSGKSNIVDAILWSLGERSHKTLRGHGPTDVIFNGAQERKPMGLAEVSLFFDNADKRLPLDFHEIQVTRRVFRDGESDYAINKTNCRLRDVVDLFLDTGLGPEAYSVISQREIDSILSARPEDRRAIVEGAAGVQKYRARRGETRRKLDRVEADLTRVADITFELSNQVGPLGEQAELAREHGTYAARLRQLQLAVLARDYDVRLRRLEGLQQTRDASGQSATQAREEIGRLEGVEAELEARLRRLESAMEGTQSETTEVVSRLKAAEGSIAVARERRRALTEQQEFQAQEIGLLRARIATATSHLAFARAELEAALQSSASLSDAAAQAEAQLGAANARLSEATRELQTRQAKVIELMRAGQSRGAQAATGRAEAQALENRLGELQKLGRALEAEAKQVEESLQGARRELEATRARQTEATAKVEAARQEVVKARETQTARGEMNNRIREEKSSLASRLRALRELEQNLEGVQGGARSVLNAVKRGQLDDKYTLVADALRAPQDIENAIEVALGAGVHNLLCPSDSDAKTAIAWLKKNQAGRATFLPLPNLRPSVLSERTRNLRHERGVLGIASELVECAREHEAAIDYLLGRVVIVETLDVAVQLAKRCENGARLVTLDGELVLPAGAITGGQGRQKASGLLARKRELDELDERISNLERDLATGAQELEASRKGVEAAEIGLRAAQEAANEARNQIARQEREEEHGQREMRRVQTNREAAQGQERATQANLQAKAAQREQHEHAATQIENQSRALDAEVAQAQKHVAERQAERENIGSGVAEVRANYGATQERLSAMRHQIAELERQIKEAESGIAGRQAGIERASGEDQNLVSREAEFVAQLSQAQKRRDELEAASHAGRTRRSETLAQTQETSGALRARRAALHEAEDELHRAEVRLASTEAEMLEIERRFQEEFEIPVDEAMSFRDEIEGKQVALDEIEVLKDKIGRLGQINLGAIEQHAQVLERLQFLQAQSDDLQASKTQLEEIIAEVDNRTRAQFLSTFKAIQAAFEEMFGRIFDGGTTSLALTDEDNLLETGVELKVQLPGKGKQDISLLSGGERALTALAFMLALLKVRPSPFVVLDEVDAPLDQSNVGRFAQLLREFTDQTQFIVITHNSGTMQAADVLYGVTMQNPGVSTLMSVRLVDDSGAPLNGHSNGHIEGLNGASNGRARAVAA